MTDQMPPDVPMSPPPTQKSRGGNRTLITVLIVLLVLCCCCAAIGGIAALWQNGDQWFGTGFVTTLLALL
jgi:hypothetical protein